MSSGVISSTYFYGSTLFYDGDGFLRAVGDGVNKSNLGTVTLADDTFTQVSNTAMFGGGVVFGAQAQQVAGSYLYLLDNSLFLYEIAKSTMTWTSHYWGNGSTSSVDHNWASNRGSVVFKHSNGSTYWVGHAPTQGLVVCIDVTTGVVAGGVRAYAFFNPGNVRDSTYGNGFCGVDGDIVWSVNYNATSKKISAISFDPGSATTTTGGSPNYKVFSTVNRFVIRDYSALGYTAQCARFQIDPGHALIIGTDLGGTTDADQAKLIRWDYNTQTVTHETTKNFYGAWPADDGFSNIAGDGHIYLLQYGGAPFAPDLTSQVLMKVSLTDLTVASTTDLTADFAALRASIPDTANITTIAIDHPGGSYSSSARVTITAPNNFTAFQNVTFSGLTTETWLNGNTYQVWFAGLSGTQFTLKTTASDTGGHADTGIATDAAAGGVAWFNAATGETYLTWITSSKASSPIYAVVPPPRPTIWMLSDVVTDICKRAGIDSTELDVTQIDTIPVRGYLLAHQMDAKSALQPLLAAYFVDAVESDFKLKFIPRGVNTSVLSIPEGDLGLKEDKAKLVEQRGQEQELAREVEVLFVDPDISYNQNTARTMRSSRVVKSKQKYQMQLPIVLTVDEARQIAEKALYLSYLERIPYTLSLWKASYMVLDPCDVVQFTYEGNPYQIRVLDSTIGVSYTSALNGVSDNALTYLSEATSQPGEAPVNDTFGVATTDFYLYDLPYLEDSDAATDLTGYYAFMGSGLTSWPGAVLYKSTDNATYIPVVGSVGAGVYGTVVGTLSDPPALWTWDNDTQLILSLTYGSLASVTDLDVLNGANVLIVGNEVIQYVNAFENPDGTWLLTRLLRGRRNTEYAAYGHAANEVAIDPTTGLQHVASSMATVGLDRWYKGVTVGQDPTAVSSLDFTIHANDLKPACPVGVAGEVDGSDNWTLGWFRRTRYNGDWRDGTGDVPLNETTQSYAVEIYNSSWVLKRTITTTSNRATYSAADQVADFGSTQGTLYLKVYQVSSSVGVGFPAVATITAGLSLPPIDTIGAAGGGFLVNGA